MVNSFSRRISAPQMLRDYPHFHEHFAENGEKMVAARAALMPSAQRLVDTYRGEQLQFAYMAVTAICESAGDRCTYDVPGVYEGAYLLVQLYQSPHRLKFMCRDWR